MEYKLIIEEKHSIALNNNIIIGECKYELKDNILNIYHTYVDPNYRGQGIAKKLVNMIEEYAKVNNLTIKAKCSYVNKGRS